MVETEYKAGDKVWYSNLYYMSDKNPTGRMAATVQRMEIHANARTGEPVIMYLVLIEYPSMLYPTLTTPSALTPRTE